MTELRKLVKRYVDGDIDYAEFRRLFVPYAACPNVDSAIQSAVKEIEEASADFVEAMISEASLRLALQRFVAEPEIVREPLFDYDPAREKIVTGTSGRFSHLIEPGMLMERSEIEFLMEFAS